MRIAVCQMKMEHTQEANLRKCLAATGVNQIGKQMGDKNGKKQILK